MWVRCILALTGAALIASATVHADDTLPPVLISRQLSEGEHLSVGDVIRLSASEDGSNVQQFRIAGIYEPTPDPARLGAVIREVQLHLPDLLGLTREPSAPSGSEYVQTINVALVDPNDADAFSRDVRARMPGIDAQPASGAAESTGPFIVLRRFHLAIAIVTIVASTVLRVVLPGSTVTVQLAVSADAFAAVG